VEEAAAVRSVNEEALLREYYEILKVVGEFDGRLMTVKGWGVTLSLAALAWGFQYGHYGLFLVAALSGLAFWLIEGTVKRHQMRYYLRMREIEVLQYQGVTREDAKAFSSPRIDSSWSYAGVLYAGEQKAEYRPVAVRGPRQSYRFAWFFPHVFLPHLISVLSGLVLFLLGIHGSLGKMTW
jgi:ADP-ribose pyrophosphatase YjhB (NUDIX family)